MKNWKVIVGVIGVFLLGMMAGGLLTARLIQKRTQRAFMAGSPRAAEFVTRRLDRELRLDEEQRRQVLTIMQATQHELREVYAEARPRIGGVLADSNRKVREVLRPEQQEKYDRILAERRARWQTDRTKGDPK